MNSHHIPDLIVVTGSGNSEGDCGTTNVNTGMIIAGLLREQDVDGLLLWMSSINLFLSPYV